MPTRDREPHSIAESETLLHRCGDDPAGHLMVWQRERAGRDGLLVVDFSMSQYWLEGQPPLALTALYCQNQSGLQVAVTDQSLVTDGSAGPEQFAHWVEAGGLAAVRPDTPVVLRSRAIPKPWGQEIWYSGVEKRGVCEFSQNGGATPIPWLQAALPGGAYGSPGTDLVLLKILDPLPIEVTGDLYFELHQKKREVYVVTHVDEQAWPDGTGYIRYGFSAEKLASYPDEQAFRAAYLEAVLAYERVRRSIDEAGAVPAGELVARETALRKAMESFTHMHPLRVGDVVKVPLLLPHSLQHGVRTIEFQTPVYERQILSFCQRVLTQDYWDTREAIKHMVLRPPPGSAPERLIDADGCRVERIVDFDDFQVLRIELACGCSHPVAPLTDYALTVTLKGTLQAGGTTASPEEALLLPRNWSGNLDAAASDQELVVLLAIPRA